MKNTGQKYFFISNIKFLRDRRKMTQAAMAAELQMTRSRLAALEAGNTKAPQIEDYVKYSEYFRISIDALLKIDLSRLGELKLRELEAGNDVYIKGGNLRVLAISVDTNNNEHVEHVPVKAKAGYQAGYNDPEFIATLPRYSLPNIPEDGTYRIFTITGDSMLPIPDGSEVVGQYVADWTILRPDTPCVVVLKAEQDFVFKLVSLEADGTFALKSLNKQYMPFSVAAADVLELWKFHSYITREFPEPVAEMTTVLGAIRSLEEKVDRVI